MTRPDARKPEHLEYRAAGQAVVAHLLSVPICNITGNGVTVGHWDWPEAGEDEHFSADELRAQLAIGLGGIAAVDCYRFGIPPSGAVVVSHNFNEGQLEDWAIAYELTGQIDPHGADDVLFLTWEYVLGLVREPDVQAAIDRVAAALVTETLNGTDVGALAAGTATRDRPK